MRSENIFVSDRISLCSKFSWCSNYSVYLISIGAKIIIVVQREREAGNYFASDRVSSCSKFSSVLYFLYSFHFDRSKNKYCSSMTSVSDRISSCSNFSVYLISIGLKIIILIQWDPRILLSPIAFPPCSNFSAYSISIGMKIAIFNKRLKIDD